MKQAPAETTLKNKSFQLTLWVPVVLAFFVVSVAWYFLIQIARDHPTQTVPLAHSVTSEQNAE